MSRVLILTITAGEGHNSTARALRSAFEQAGAECRVLDLYGYYWRPIRWAVNAGYLFMAAHMKRTFGRCYVRWSKNRRGGFGGRRLRFEHDVFCRKFERYLRKYRPDVIVCTHSLAAMATDSVKKRGRTGDFRFVGVDTDFTLLAYWEECPTADALVIANHFIDDRIEKKQIDPARVYDLGIPIDAKFAESGDRAGARGALGLDPALPTVLVMSGSMGHGDMARQIEKIDALSEDFQIICVCGRNKKALERVRTVAKEARHRVLALGFVGDVDRVMDAADVIVSKPGGLSTSEAFAKRLPLIVVDPIPGHEEENAALLSAAGAAVIPGEGGVADCVRRFLTDGELRASLRDAVEKIRRPDAARDVCALALSLCGEGDGEDKENNDSSEKELR